MASAFHIYVKIFAFPVATNRRPGSRWRLKSWTLCRQKKAPLAKANGALGIGFFAAED
jgi:hypothetical protein